MSCRWWRQRALPCPSRGWGKARLGQKARWQAVRWESRCRDQRLERGQWDLDLLGPASTGNEMALASTTGTPCHREAVKMERRLCGECAKWISRGVGRFVTVLLSITQGVDVPTCNAVRFTNVLDIRLWGNCRSLPEGWMSEKLIRTTDFKRQVLTN